MHNGIYKWRLLLKSWRKIFDLSLATGNVSCQIRITSSYSESEGYMTIIGIENKHWGVFLCREIIYASLITFLNKLYWQCSRKYMHCVNSSKYIKNGSIFFLKRFLYLKVHLTSLFIYLFM